MSLPYLQQEELIAPWRSVNKILSPSGIPIHPRVYDSDFAYTQDFLDEVHAKVPEAMLRDLSAIEKIIGERLDVQVEGGRILTGVASVERMLRLRTDLSEADRKRCLESCAHSLDQIKVEARPAERLVHAGVYATTMGILPHLPQTVDLCFYDQGSSMSAFNHPLPREKAEHYARKEESNCLTAPGWYTHNIHDQGEGLFLYLRNFAIVFNNLGLERSS